MGRTAASHRIADAFHFWGLIKNGTAAAPANEGADVEGMPRDFTGSQADRRAVLPSFGAGMVPVERSHPRDHVDEQGRGGAHSTAAALGNRRTSAQMTDAAEPVTVADASCRGACRSGSVLARVAVLAAYLPPLASNGISRLKSVMARSTTPDLVFIGLLPPPIDGQRFATLRMRELLGQSLTLATYNIGPAETGSIKGRVMLSLRAMLGLLTARIGGCRSLYFAPYTGRSLWLAALIQLWARLLGYVSYVHIHSHLHIANRRRSMAAFCAAGGGSAVHICLGEQMATDLLAHYQGAKRAISLSNALIFPPLPPRGATSVRGDALFRLGHLSNLMVDKGLDTVLACVPALVARGIPFVIEIAGPAQGEESALLQAALARHPQHLRYVGPLYDQAKDDWFRSLDIFLFPTRYRHESSPLVLFEAMRAGAVPIATDRGCIADVVGDAGIVVAESPPSLFVDVVVERLTTLLGQRDEMAVLAARAQDRFATLHRSAEAVFADISGGRFERGSATSAAARTG